MQCGRAQEPYILLLLKRGTLFILQDPWFRFKLPRHLLLYKCLLSLFLIIITWCGEINTDKQTKLKRAVIFRENTHSPHEAKSCQISDANVSSIIRSRKISFAIVIRV